MSTSSNLIDSLDLATNFSEIKFRILNFFFILKMPKNNKDNNSDSESEKSKNETGSGSEGEEEEYVVEKVVDKRIMKSGKVCSCNIVGLHSASYFCCCFLPFLLRPNISLSGRDTNLHKTHGSQRRTWIARNS